MTVILYPLEYMQRTSKTGEPHDIRDHLSLRSNIEYFGRQDRDVAVRRPLSLLVEVLRQKSAEAHFPGYRFFGSGHQAVAEHLGLDDPTMN